MDISTIKTPVFKLQAITLLDSICYGLIYGFISPYILSLGADHLEVGILSVGNLICNLLSADLINYLSQFQGKQNSLFLVLGIATVSHLLLVSTGNYWCTIFSRYVFSITNQSQNLCKDLLLQNTPKDERDYYLTRHNALSAAGYVIGPLLCGYLYHFGFIYDVLLAAALTLANAYVIYSIPKQDNMPQQTDKSSFLEKTGQKADDVIHSFKKSDYQKNWDILAIKFLYVSSITIFFSKFTQILKHNYHATPFLIGYTTSYMNSLTFIGTYFASSIKNHYSDYSIVILAQYGLIVSGATLLFACYSPIYNVYAVLCIPLIFSTTFMNSIWQDFFESRGNDSLTKINISMGILAGLTIPLIFGLICNVIGHHAVIIFSVIPILVSLFIIRKYTLNKLHEEENEKSKDE